MCYTVAPTPPPTSVGTVYDVSITGPANTVTAVTNRVKTLRVKVKNTGDDAIARAELTVTAPDELTLVKSSMFPK